MNPPTLHWQHGRPIDSNVEQSPVWRMTGIRRQASINDDILVEKVDHFIARNFAKIVDESPEFTLLPCIKLRLILGVNDARRPCCDEDIANRALQYFQTLPHSFERIEQWIEQLAEKVCFSQSIKEML
ncbi:unnamed protein product [Gongylonema pulchrum]|uniref:Uncharacterized protein n=1 Tax=Gongylonema pulchrum TaxID=637853 RepID=A0A183DG81_9BILA|nr:unnamed protein product [Gongylonema pulchrum]